MFEEVVNSSRTRNSKAVLNASIDKGLYSKYMELSKKYHISTRVVVERALQSVIDGAPRMGRPKKIDSK